MREIKFRAWDKEAKTMHASDGRHMGRGFGVLLFSFEPRLTDRWDVSKSPEEQIDNLSYYEFMQYTGLSDKNGVEIYEGDIVHFPEITFIVSWDEYRCSFRFGKDAWNPTFINGRCEVIGNIYENPKLLETPDDHS